MATFRPRSQDIAARDFALFFQANHKSADSAAAEVGVGNTKYGSIRSGHYPGEDVHCIKEFPPVRILEIGKKQNNQTVRKMFQPFL